MSFDINALKRISQSTTQVIASKEEKKSYTDDRFWKLERDPKTGNGGAVIRFLPALKEGELPWVQTFNYFIKSPSGRYYIEKSRRTIKQPDPMRELISSKWNKQGISEMEKEDLRKNFREQMQYVANVLIIDDPKHPEFNGKVKLFSFGKKIYEKIISRTNDEFGDSCNIFDWTSGCNFKLRCKTIDKFPNYDSSEFVNPSALSDDVIMSAAEQAFDLTEFVDPKNFKSYDVLKQQVDELFGNGAVSPSVPSPMVQPVTTTVTEEPVVASPSTTPPWSEQEAEKEEDDLNVDELLRDLK